MEWGRLETERLGTVFLSLKDLNLRNQYRSDRHNLLEDFYIPCLSRSLTYDRAVGFFSSTSLAAAAKGMTALIRAGGRMRLIASPHLSQEDADAIAQGLKQREEVITTLLLHELEQLDQLATDRLEYLAWLLSKGMLEIKLAVHHDPSQRGIYHEKLGILRDANDNIVIFTGSANESASGLIDNFECLDVFRSWRSGDDERIAEKTEDFQRLWQNQTPTLEVLEFPEAARRSLLKLCPQEPLLAEPRMSEPSGLYSTSSSSSDGVPRVPSWLKLRPYQQQAIDNWFANKGRGTLKMATGSGKTITALAIAAELYRKSVQQNKPLQGLLIVCPYRHLVTQWEAEVHKFGLQPVLAFETLQSWQGELQSQLLAVLSGNQRFVTVITTNATLIRDSFQSQLQFFPKRSLIIGDEAHNLGATRLESSLPQEIKLRLALSATPERYFDERGTERLFEYFGSVLKPEFTLRDAIAAKALVPYLYYPVLVELTEPEIERYEELTGRIGRAIGIGGDADDNELLTALLMQRARIVGAATNKLDALRQIMSTRLQTSHTLFYCGDGSVEDELTEESHRQIAAVTALLQDDLSYRVKTYTAETILEEREELRYQFMEGILQGLVAIRCLDEGVDIPAIQTAVILASSSNPRQFVQRRGRILRPSPGKERAELFDMIVIPPDLGRESWSIERNLLRKELQRFVEFADLAVNSGQARKILLPLQEKYQLLEL
ncbi:DNA phosphorothioation system restriction enzyme [Phormidium sp. CLA17]|uniref:DNA phosphorothioation system restriction enzyme n=1 Tax=Leptolyngbya sp. Cla-17 TaxID=2803751 RepID=UPI001491E1D3|nr:DNA phosphorothioation system restriction enzyme [Leptolyngbya sp. Cla-17]MBM0740252.1 DNA phosphorothioation system restriction enzyme [Leptolyngbya sp. Cla-17]